MSRKLRPQLRPQAENSGGLKEIARECESVLDFLSALEPLTEWEIDMTQTTRNLSSGKWAVAISGMRGWCNDMALGNGITEAMHALVGRYQTKDEAEAEAKKLNDAQPAVMPGSPSVHVFEARKYDPTDYIGRQNLERGQNRDCDRRIANID